MFDSCKPHQVHTIMNEEGMSSALHQKLLISILAGVTISQLRNWVTQETMVIRAMPNTPSKVHFIISRVSLSYSCFPPRDTRRNDRNLNLPSKLSRGAPPKNSPQHIFRDWARAIS